MHPFPSLPRSRRLLPVRAAALLAVGVVLLATSLAAQDRAPVLDRTFDDVISVLEVEVPVQVLVRGEPVDGLEASNFEIWDRGERRDIVAFEVIDLRDRSRELEPATTSVERRDDPEDWAGRPLPALTNRAERHFLLLFDLALSPRPYLARAVDSARVMVREQLHPSDRVGIALLGSYGVQLVLGFTEDPDLVAIGLDYIDAQLDAKRKRVEETAQRLVEAQENTLRALSLSIGPTAAVALGAPSETVSAQVPFAASDFSFLSDLAAAGGSAAGEALAFLELSNTLAQSDTLSRVRSMNQSLESLVTMLAGLPGQRHLLYFSEGLQGFATHVVGGPMGGPTRQAWGTGAGMSKTFAELVDGLRRSGWIVQSFDLSGPRGGDVDALAYLANETGGELYKNFGRLEQATARLVDRTSVTYRLVFAAPEVERNGRYHDIEVRLVDGPPRAQVVAREGYYAPKRADQLSDLEERLEDADRLFYAEDRDELEAGLALIVEPGPGDRSRIWVLLDAPAGAWVDDPEARARLRFDIQGYVGRPGPGGRGVVVEDVFVERVKANASRFEDQLRESLTFLGELSAPPGEWEVRVRVTERRGESELLESRRLRIEEPGERAGSAASPVTLIAREARLGFRRQESELAVAEPLTFEVAGRRLRPSALAAPGPVELLTLVEAGATPADGELVGEGRLIDASGAEAASFRLVPEVVAPAGTDWKVFLSAVELDVPPGRYRLLVSWRQGGDELGASEQAIQIAAETRRERAAASGR